MKNYAEPFSGSCNAYLEELGRRVLSTAAAARVAHYATGAVLDHSLTRIEQVVEVGDADIGQHPFAREFGRRWVYLPMGGRPGDHVEVDDDGEATVVFCERGRRGALRCALSEEPADIRAALRHLDSALGAISPHAPEESRAQLQDQLRRLRLALESRAEPQAREAFERLMSTAPSTIRESIRAAGLNAGLTTSFAELQHYISDDLPRPGAPIIIEAHGKQLRVKRMVGGDFAAAIVGEPRVRFGNACEIREDIDAFRAYGILQRSAVNLSMAEAGTAQYALGKERHYAEWWIKTDDPEIMVRIKEGGEFVILGDESRVTDAELLALVEASASVFGVPGWRRRGFAESGAAQQYALGVPLEEETRVLRAWIEGSDEPFTASQAAYLAGTEKFRRVDVWLAAVIRDLEQQGVIERAGFSGGGAVLFRRRSFSEERQQHYAGVPITSPLELGDVVSDSRDGGRTKSIVQSVDGDRVAIKVVVSSGDLPGLGVGVVGVVKLEWLQRDAPTTSFGDERQGAEAVRYANNRVQQRFDRSIRDAVEETRAAAEVRSAGRAAARKEKIRAQVPVIERMLERGRTSSGAELAPEQLAELRTMLEQYQRLL